MKKEKIPVKNYVSVLLISISTIVLTITISNYFKQKIEYQNQANVTAYLSEIKLEELDNFIVENHEIMILLLDGNNSSKLQNKMKKIILDNNYNKDMVVLYISDMESLSTKLKNKYSSENQNSKLTFNSLLLIKDGKIKSTFEINEDSLKNMKSFIETNFYGEK